MDTKNIVTLVGVGVVSAGAGATVAHILTRKKYEKWAEEEIADVRQHFVLLRKEGPLATPESAAEHLAELREEKHEVDEEIKEYTEGLEDLGYKAVSTEDMEDNVPEGAEPLKIGDKVGRFVIDDRPIPSAIEEPSDDHPYLIREDEWHEGFENHEQILLTYYDQDDTLCDESERTIDNIEQTVGHEALTKFGVGSNDTQIVYVRNKKNSCDYEVTLNSGSYTTLVLGFNETEKPRVRKMRDHE